MAPSPTSFPPGSRLGTPAEFGRVFAAPIRSSDALFTVLARASGQPVPRLGLAISRRAAKRAVDRNRIKRMARESFRTRHSLPPLDFVVLARPGAAAADNALLRRSLDEHFTKLARRGARHAPGVQ